MATSKKRPERESSASADLPGESGRRSIHGDNVDYGDRVAARAYEIYLERGAADGRDFDDWLSAERELASGHDRRGDPGE